MVTFPAGDGGGGDCRRRAALIRNSAGPLSSSLTALPPRPRENRLVARIIQLAGAALGYSFALLLASRALLKFSLEALPWSSSAPFGRPRPALASWVHLLFDIS